MLRLVVLSAALAWALVLTVIGGVFVTLQALERARRQLEQVTMGVRAIEKQAQRLGPDALEAERQLQDTARALDDAAGALGALAERRRNSG